MSHRLEDELEELQLSQYLDAFVDQGFDTWETILDITESDLDALGVKLGHRRKLQRRIANYRGVAPEASLASPTRTAADDSSSRAESSTKQDTPSNFSLDSRGAVPGVLAKRKYRRHPKPDENAPERPPSAYVLFSNKTREELKGRNLTFTEIAKHVGENWQGLSAAEREPFETQAQLAKDKYNQELSEYKKTDNYKSYMVYLQEFKAKHNNGQTQDKDAFKRIKLTEFSSSSTPTLGTSSASPPATHPDFRRHNKRKSGSVTGHASRSGSEGPYDNDGQHAHQKRRLGSTASGTESHYSGSSTPGLTHSPTTLGHQPTGDKHNDAVHSYHSPSSRPTSMSPSVHAASVPPPNYNQSSSIRGSESGGSAQMSLPPLSHMFDDRHPHPSTANAPRSGPTQDAANNSNGHSGNASPGLAPHSNSMVTSSSSASNASNGSASTYSTASSNGSASYPRTPLDGSMPIHALLSGTSKPMSPTSPHSSTASPNSTLIPPHPQPYPQSGMQHPPPQHPPHYPSQHQQPQYPPPQQGHSYHTQPQGPPPSYHNADSPKESPPPSSWNYPHGPSPAERSPMFREHAVGNMVRQPASAPYPFRS